MAESCCADGAAASLVQLIVCVSYVGLECLSFELCEQRYCAIVHSVLLSDHSCNVRAAKEFRC